MKFFRICFVALLCCAALSSCTREYDVCVYGGTSAGVMAAYASAQRGCDVIVVEPSGHIGGMTTGGLGYTDIGNKYAVGGLALQFYRRLGEHYGSFEKWVFEPSVASEIMGEYLAHPRIRLLAGQAVESVVKEGTEIKEIVLTGGKRIAAKCFIDCSYEGDLMARSGVSYVVGREDNSVYGETWNGSQFLHRHQFPDGIDPYKVPGDPSSGLLWGITDETLPENGTGDKLVQAYNYRICLTDSLENMIPIARPENYDSTRYDLLARLIAACPTKTSLDDWFIWSKMPGRKTDVNNRGGFSTDVIGLSHDYPEASYAERDSIVKAHKDYTLGLLYFYGHDSRVPSVLREQMLSWGLPKDEYVASGHWTPQLYVRESRRLKGEYVATQADCEGRAVASDGIAMAAYTMDSHNCRRMVVDGMVKNEGNVEVGGGLPYPVSYQSLTPLREECTNLLVPVCLSASHIAYGSIRMEPVFMLTAQASGIAAAMVCHRGGAVQDIKGFEVAYDIEKDPFMDGTQPDIVLTEPCEIVGPWKIGTKKGYGPKYYILTPCEGVAVIGFETVIPSDGEYEIYSYEHVGDYSPLTSINISSVSGEEYFVALDRNSWKVSGQTKGEWVRLARLAFKAGEKVYVYYDNGLSPDAELRVNAVQFVKRK